MAFKRNILNVVVALLILSILLTMFYQKYITATILAIVTFSLSFYRKYFYDLLKKLGY